MTCTCIDTFRTFRDGATTVTLHEPIRDPACPRHSIPRVSVVTRAPLGPEFDRCGLDCGFCGRLADHPATP